MRKADGPRKSTAVDIRGSPNLSAVTPDKEAEDPFDVMKGGQAATVAAKNAALARDNSPNSQNKDKDLLTPITNDGGKVKRGRRGTATLASPIATPKSRKRGNSHSGLASAVDADSQEGIWSQDAGEAGTWTIASTGELPLCMHAIETLTLSSVEIARHTFYIPPICFDGLAPFKCKATGCPDSFLTPIPSVPLGNLPVVRKYLVKESDSSDSEQAKQKSISECIGRKLAGSD